MVPDDSTKPLEDVLAALDKQIGVVERAGLSMAALSLKMAKMEIQLKVSCISDEEFDAFVDVLTRKNLERVDVD